MIKLVVSDVDGTLLEKGKEKIDAKLSESIRRLKEKGIIFAVASGRHLSELNFITEELRNDDIYYISSDGGCIANNGKVIRCSPIEDEVVNKYKNRENYIIQTSENVYYTGDNERLRGALIKKYRDGFVFKHTVNIRNAVKIIKYGAGYSETPPLTYEIYKDRKWCEWIRMGTSKGEAVRYLQKMFDIKTSETLVIGDNINDLSMMRCGGERVCMDKSPGILKSLSDRICYDIEREIESIGGKYE